MKKQGYNSRDDEAIAARNGKKKREGAKGRTVVANTKAAKVRSA